MSHCFSVGVQINGEEKEICTVVPGNEDLAKRVLESERTGKANPTPTQDEIRRAIDYHINSSHEHAEPPKKKGSTTLTR